MSSQNTIRSAMNGSEALWIAPSKDQYLPAYFYKKAMDYEDSPDPAILKPVTAYGIQNIDEVEVDTYCFPNNIDDVFYTVKDGVVTRVSGMDVGLIVVNKPSGKGKASMPRDLVNGAGPIRNLLEILKGSMGSNFPSTVASFAAAAIAMHFSTVKSVKQGVPVPALVGEPGSGKSSIAVLAMEAIGVHTAHENCTYNGMLKILEKDCIPILWEDVDQFKICEQISMQIFNQGKKVTAVSSGNPPKSLPIITSNGFLKDAPSEMNVKRLIGRMVIIPFQKVVSKIESVQSLLEFESMLLSNKHIATNCFSYFLQLKNHIADFSLNKTDFTLLNDILLDDYENHQADQRTIKNYNCLMFLMKKILEDSGCTNEEISSILKSFFDQAIQAHDPEAHGFGNEIEMKGKEALTNKLTEACTSPTKFPWLRISARNCSSCGEVLMFNYTKICEGLSNQTHKSVKKFIAQNGCMRRTLKYWVDGKQKPCFHIKLASIDDDIVTKIKKITLYSPAD
ncbi:uncharacterized protein [Clytia hemisphaerica]|uniref:uncharacterized protein n=1 Tax=Clytia hemisphaerica TaxID=252671 RepID=UPI0034D45DAE